MAEPPSNRSTPPFASTTPKTFGDAEEDVAATSFPNAPFSDNFTKAAVLAAAIDAEKLRRAAKDLGIRSPAQHAAEALGIPPDAAISERPQISKAPAPIKPISGTGARAVPAYMQDGGLTTASGPLSNSAISNGRGNGKPPDKPPRQDAGEPGRDFWIAIGLWGSALVTVLGCGLYAFIEHSWGFGWGFTAVGLCGMIYMTLHLKGHRLRIDYAAAAMLVATWLLIGTAVWEVPDHFWQSQVSIVAQQPDTRDATIANQQKQVDDLKRQIGELQAAARGNPPITSDAPLASPKTFSETYNLTDADIRNLRDAVFAIRNDLPGYVRFQTADDGEARRVANGLSKAFGLAGIDVAGMSVGYPVTVQEIGISIRVPSLQKIPPAAIRAAKAIEGVTHVAPLYTPDSRVGEGGFFIFVGTNPNER